MTQEQWMGWMKIGHFLGCHQMAERSFFYRGCQFPVCARCTGVLIAAFFALPCFFMARIPVFLAFLFSGVMLFDWTLQYLNILQSTNVRRLITGLVGGFGWTTLHFYFYLFLFHLWQG